MNNIGPKTEPWGTPYITFSEVDRTCVVFTSVLVSIN